MIAGRLTGSLWRGKCRNASGWREFIPTRWGLGPRGMRIVAAHRRVGCRTGTRAAFPLSAAAGDSGLPGIFVDRGGSGDGHRQRHCVAVVTKVGRVVPATACRLNESPKSDDRVATPLSFLGPGSAGVDRTLVVAGVDAPAMVRMGPTLHVHATLARVDRDRQRADLAACRHLSAAARSAAAGQKFAVTSAWWPVSSVISPRAEHSI